MSKSFMGVKLIASQRWDVFLRHSVDNTFTVTVSLSYAISEIQQDIGKNVELSYPVLHAMALPFRVVLMNFHQDLRCLWHPSVTIQH